MSFIDVSKVSLIYPGHGIKRGRSAPLALKRDSKIGSEILQGGKGVYALKDVSVSLKAGDRLGIVGSNGSGKSTLLQVMAGIMPPSAGEVTHEGEISALFNVGIGMKMEASGITNIILSGLIHGLTRKEAKDRVPEIAEFSGLGDYLHMPIRTYSRGMVMRLAFATATSFEPEILLLDEWIGAGDDDFRDKAQERMNSLVGGAGIVVIASHRLPLLKEICTQFLWLQSGQVVEYGNDVEIVNRFRDRNKSN